MSGQIVSSGQRRRRQEDSSRHCHSGDGFVFFVFRETVNRVYSIGSRGNDSNDSVNYCCIFDDGTEQSVSQPMKMVIVVVHDDSFHVWSQILLNMKEEKRRREKKYVKTQLVN